MAATWLAGLALLALAVSGCRLEPNAPSGEPSDGAQAESALPEGAVTARDPAEAAPEIRQAPSGLVIPVAGVAPSDLVDTFEQARSDGRTHDAIDIPAPRGTPVVAAASGTVAHLFTSDQGGRTVYQLGTDQRTVYYYAHLDAYADDLREGQTVRAGQRLGAVGDSGNAAPGDTHLHFAIWRVADPADVWDGVPVNPYRLLAR